MAEAKPSILLVEDELAHAELIRRAFLRLEGRFELTVARNLAQAREALERREPDLILADLQLPDGQGIELLAPEAEPQSSPLVVLTAHGGEEVAVEAMKAGALDYVVKSPTVLRDMPRVAERALREWQHIAERRRVEEERRQLEIRLEHSQRLESLGILAGGIAHDFNNVVMAIMGHAGMAIGELEREPENQAWGPCRSHCTRSLECVREIETAAARASDLCRQLLAYSGRNRFVVEPIDLGALVGEMAQLLKAAISKRAELVVLEPPELPAVEGAATQIRQIVMNLIMNASDALGGERGRITVKSGTMRADEEYLATCLDPELPAGDYVYLEVADTGSGMDQATRDKLFDPFFTTKARGRGLGMAATQGILRSHQGTLHLVTELGEGTTFRVLFPASDKPLPREEETPAAGTEPAPPRRGASAILVVDDDITIRTVTTVALEGAGYLVLAATTGRQAVTRYRDHRGEIAAVLLDLNMPDADGDEAFRELEQLGSVLPVIVCSGSAEAEARERIPGLAGFLQKPYKAETLIAEVRRVLHSSPAPPSSRRPEVVAG